MSKHPYISAFDLDHTLLKVNSSFHFGRYLYRQKVFNFASMIVLSGCYAAHQAGILTIPQLHNKIFAKLFHEASVPLMKSHAQAFLDYYFEKHLYFPAIRALKEAQRENHYTVILSSSPDFLVEIAAKKLDVHDWKASTYAYDERLLFSHISRLVQGEDKARYIDSLCKELGVPKQRVVAYSDSIHDLPFLLSAGTAVGVRPDQALRKYCYQRQWNII